MFFLIFFPYIIKLISIEFDVLIIGFFDAEIRRRIMRAKISKRFDIFAFIICRPISKFARKARSGFAYTWEKKIILPEIRRDL